MVARINPKANYVPIMRTNHDKFILDKYKQTSCFSKQKYHSLDEAYSIINTDLSRYSNNAISYKCEFCGGFHITSNNKSKLTSNVFHATGSYNG